MGHGPREKERVLHASLLVACILQLGAVMSFYLASSEIAYGLGLGAAVSMIYPTYAIVYLRRGQASGEKNDSRADLRLKSALDACKTNVMVADENHTIVYMNKSMAEMMLAAEADVKKDMPKFNARTIVGSSMDVFHEKPAHQRRMLDNLKNNIETSIGIGGRHFYLGATPIYDEAGKRIGTAVEWKDETAEKTIESEIDNLVRAAATGDLSGRVSLDGKKGFMLSLAKSMNELCNNMATVTDDLVRMFSSLAGGNFKDRITADYGGSFGQLKTDANAMADRIGSTIGEIKIATQKVMVSSGDGGMVIGKAIDAMARIEDSSRKVVEIIAVIDEIARQTNLLALNANVEAARAGEAGRGFAVVAAEVRNLAVRAAAAAKDIKDLITNSNSQVKDGVDLVNRAGAALKEIVESGDTVKNIISSISIAEANDNVGSARSKITKMPEKAISSQPAKVRDNAAPARMRAVS